VIEPEPAAVQESREENSITVLHKHLEDDGGEKFRGKILTVD
jgi:hypothetical protein